MSHAVLAVYKDVASPEEMIQPMQEAKGDPVLLCQWASLDYPKVTLEAKSIKDVYRAEEMANSKGIYNCCVHDAGRTQVAPDTPTVCAFGPCSWKEA